MNLTYSNVVVGLFLFTEIVYCGYVGGEKMPNSVYEIIEWPLECDV